MPSWLEQILNYWGLTWTEVLLGLTIAVVASVGGLLLVSLLLIRLPATYFCASRPRTFWVDQHPVIRWTGLAIKNIAGAILVAVGVLLSLPGIPGPGFLTILIGIVLLDFPGKRRLEIWIISRPRVLETINALRARRGRPPLVLEDPLVKTTIER